MKTIRDHIKGQNFVPCYLIYGKENYLKQLYRDKLIQALCSGRDSMNFTRYEGDMPDVPELRELINTPPFLEEHRVILIENTGAFRSSYDLADDLKTMPDSTYLIFVESEVDKRSKLFQAVKEIGYATEMNGLSEDDCKLFVASQLKKDNLMISEQNVSYFLDLCGSNLVMIQSELAKLSAYCSGKSTVEKEDIDQICTVVTEGRIFWMLDAMMEHKKNRALKLYGDLLALHEKPMQILYHLNRSFLQLAQVSALLENGNTPADVAKQLSLAPFIVTKYQRLKKGFTPRELKNAVNFGTELEHKVKIGDMDESMAVEMFLIKYSSEKKA